MALNINEKIKNTFIKNSYSTSTTDGYSANYVNGLVADTGWIEITQSDLAQGTAGTGYYVPMYRKIGNVVYLKGQVTGITTRASAIFTLPSGYYNNSKRLSFCTTNDSLEVNFIRVLNTGVVQIQQTTGTLSSGVNAFFDGICFTID